MSENKTRVWQWTDITFDHADKSLNENRIIIPANIPPRLCTFSRGRDGNVTAELFIVKANNAFQYVIDGFTKFYNEQCESMELLEKTTYEGKLVEITKEPDLKIGVIPKKYRPQPPKTVNESILENEVARLRAELEEAKNRKEKK